jgi:hypothetical protein
LEVSEWKKQLNDPKVGIMKVPSYSTYCTVSRILYLSVNMIILAPNEIEGCASRLKDVMNDTLF